MIGFGKPRLFFSDARRTERAIVRRRIWERERQNECFAAQIDLGMLGNIRNQQDVSEHVP
jgi:hypothetical protein